MTLIINKDITKRINELTKLKESTLTFRALKLSEETGEVAQAVLQYEEAPGCTYRTSNQEKIVEEVVDVMLVAMSILDQLGNVSQEQLDETFTDKLNKWQDKLFEKEEPSNATTFPHEIHITLRATTEEARDNFMSICKDIGCKAVLIELQRDGIDIGEDVMTSDTVIASTEAAFQIMKDQSAHFTDHGFEVIREKIETVPWHPDAPKDFYDLEHSTGYFESHIPVTVNENHRYHNRSILYEVCKEHDVHLSRNKLKQVTEFSYTVMCTLRSRNITADGFKHDVSVFHEHLRNVGFAVPKTPVIEYAIYDSKESHDDHWLKKDA